MAIAVEVKQGWCDLLEQHLQAEMMDKRLHDLDAQCRELGHKLTRQGKAAQEGYPPDGQLIKEAESCKTAFDSAKETIMQLCQKYNLKVAALQPIGNTAQLIQLWENIKPPLKAEQEAYGTNRVPATHNVDEATILLGLIEGLIRADKLTPAFWLSAYYELIYKAKPPLPAVWLKMIEISRLVTEQDRQAVNALARFYREAAPADTDQEDFLGQWLAFSAALLPSLHAPSSGARRVLQELDALPRSLKKLTSLLLKSKLGDAQLEALAQEARHWLETNRQINDQASFLAARLWVAMLEENGLIHNLLNPVIEKDRAAREAAGKMVRYLEKEACQRKELAMQYRILLKKYRILLKDQEDSELDAFHISGSGIILNRLQEALRFSMRWLDILNGYDHPLEDENGGTPAERLHAALAEAANELQFFAMRHQSGTLSLALALAGQTLGHLANSLIIKQQSAASQEFDKPAVNHSYILLEAAILPDQKAVAQIGQAVFNYFRAELERSSPQKQNNSLSQRIKQMLAEDNPEAAQYLNNLISSQKEDFSENI